MALGTEMAMLFRIRADASQAKAEINSLGSKIQGMGKSASSGNVFAALTKSSLAADAISKVASAAYRAGEAVFNYSSNVQQLQVSFTSYLGSAREAEQLTTQLAQAVNGTPFNLESYANLAQRLLAAGVASKELIPLITDVGNVVAGTGAATSERLEGVNVALSQIISKGRLSAEEMEQLAERGIPAWKILSEAVGLPIAKVRKLAEEGKLTSDIMVAALRKIGREKFGDAMARQSDTAAGSFNKLTNKLLETSRKAFKPLFDATTKWLNETSKLVSEKGDDLGAMGIVLGNKIGEGVGTGAATAADMFYESFKGRLVRLFTGEAGQETMASAFWNGFIGALKRGATTKYSPLSLVDTFVSDMKLFFSKAWNKEQFTADELESFNMFGLLNDQISALRAGDAGRIRAIYDGFARSAAVAAEAALKMRRSVSGGGIDLKNILPDADAVKRAETFAKLIDTLTDKIAFFGETSQEAAVKQQLINQGITDLTSAEARNVIMLGQQLDKMEAAKKARDAYNSSLEEAAKHLKQMREDTDFEIKFPNATELDRFEQWVEDTGKKFKELDIQIRATRSSLQTAAYIKDIKDLVDLNEQALTQVYDQIESMSDPASAGLDQALRSVAKGLGLAGAKDEFNMDVTASYFSKKVQSFINSINTLYAELTGADSKAAMDALNEQKEAFKAFLISFKDKKGNQIIGDKTEVWAWIEALMRLAEVTGNSKELAAELLEINREIANVDDEREIAQMKDTLATLEKLLETTKNRKLVLQEIEGISIAMAQKERDRKIRQLNDEEADRKKSVEGKANELQQKEDLEKLYEKKRLQAEEEFQRERKRIIDGIKEQINAEDKGIFDGWKDSWHSFLENLRAEVGSASAAFGGLADGIQKALTSIADGIGQVVQQWVLYGETGPAAMKKVLASALATMAAEMAVKAIYALGLGFLNLAMGNFKGAADAFQAAAVFGAGAVAAGVAGRAIAGDSFKKETAPNAGTTSSSGSKRQATGGAYSSMSDGRIDVSRGAPVTPARPEIVIRDRSGMFAKLFETEVRNNSSVRRLIIETANG